MPTRKVESNQAVQDADNVPKALLLADPKYIYIPQWLVWHFDVRSIANEAILVP
jgi:hypothetical protein